MNYQDRVKKYLKTFLKPGWISLAIFVGYCIWFVGSNYPCEGYLIAFPLVLVFAILSPILLYVKSHFVTIGISFGAISGALVVPSSYFSVIQYELIHDELAITVVMVLFMGLVLGAIIGAVGGAIVWLVYTSLARFPYLQKIWIAVVLLLLLLALPWLYRASWDTFGYRWTINDLVAKHGDDLFETLMAYDDRGKFAFNSMYVYWYTDNTVDLWIARREKSATKEPIWIVNYELRLENRAWKVNHVFGVCGGNNNYQSCYDNRRSYIFQN